MNWMFVWILFIFCLCEFVIQKMESLGWIFSMKYEATWCFVCLILIFEPVGLYKLIDIVALLMFLSFGPSIHLETTQMAKSYLIL